MNYISYPKVLAVILFLFTLLIGGLAWNIDSASLLIFIAFVPVFIGVRLCLKTLKRKILFFSLSFLLFKFFWVFGQAFWLKDVTYDTFFAAVFTHILCFFFIQIPTILSFSRRTDNIPYYLFIIGWVLFEYLTQNFSLLSPFYILGTMLGEYPAIINNYSLIGIEGGSIWILLVNYFIFRIIWGVIEKNLSKRLLYTGVSIAIVPLIVSIMLFSASSDSARKVKVAALHTDFNPVNMYYAGNPNVIIDSLWNLSKKVDQETEVLLWPETVVTNLGWMQELFQNVYIDSLQRKLQDYPYLNLTFGANIYTLPTDRTDQRLNYNKEYDFYYYVHNVAFTVKKDEHVTFRSKEIFVPFQEEVPYVRSFPSMKKMITVVGNSDFYSEYENDMDIHHTSKGAGYLPLLCYEICYPLYTSEVSRDVGFIALLGNEHWNTSERGSEIYYNILVAMAIQNAVPIVKSSNNGISVICDKSGKVIAKRSFHDTGLLTGEIDLKEGNTFYSYISGYSYLLALILLPYFYFRKRKSIDS